MTNSTNPEPLLLLVLLLVLLGVAFLGMPLVTMWAVTSMVVAIAYGPPSRRGPRQGGPG